MISRRSFLKKTALSAGVFTGWAPIGACSGRSEGRNALVILCDDLNDSVEFMGGHPQARTPNLSAFAAGGVESSRSESASVDRLALL